MEWNYYLNNAHACSCGDSLVDWKDGINTIAVHRRTANTQKWKLYIRHPAKKLRACTWTLTSDMNSDGDLEFAVAACPSCDRIAELAVDSFPDLADTAECTWLCWLWRYTSVCLYLSNMFSVIVGNGLVVGARTIDACAIALSRAWAQIAESCEVGALSLKADLVLPAFTTFRTFSRKRTSSPTCQIAVNRLQQSC